MTEFRHAAACAASSNACANSPARAAGSYDLPRRRRRTLINLSENATYRIDDPAAADSWALRVHRDGYHRGTASPRSSPGCMALRNDGVVITPVPVAGRDGELIQDVGHRRCRGRATSCCSNGRAAPSRRRRSDLIEKFEVLGEVTARMHLHSQRWKRPPDFERHVWDFDTSLGDRPHWGRWRTAWASTRRSTRCSRATVELIGRRLARFGKGPERFGLDPLRHAPRQPADRRRPVKVIDFDDCGFSWHLYDAATRRLLLRARAACAGADGRLGEGLSRRSIDLADGGRSGDPDLRHAAPA